jgi:RNA polymerase sigma factor for flagellar operon FliA
VTVSIQVIAEATERAHSDEVDRYLPLFDGDRPLAALWVAARRHDDASAREQLVITYGPLVRYVVSRMNVTLPPSLERGDLVGFGTIGLIDAIGRFDLDRGLTFQTYAVTRIRGGILDELRANDWVPRAVRGAMHDIDRATVAFQQENGCEPTVGDLMEATGLRGDQVRSTMLAYQNGYLVSLEDRMRSEGSDEGAGQQFVDPTVELPEEAYDHAESQRGVRVLIRTLKPRDRAVVALYYFEELTFAEIGRVLGFSESRACQVHGRAIRSLREAC